MLNQTNTFLNLQDFGLRSNDPSKVGSWKYDLKASRLEWSDNQYNIYGYSNNQLGLNDEFFLIKTTHLSDLERISKIIEQSISERDQYSFRRRILKMDGRIGFAETHAQIVREDGIATGVKGVTIDIGGRENYISDMDKNDPLFFDLVYKNYRKAIYTEISRYCINSEVAEDICQEVFMKVWHHLNKFDEQKGSLYTWLLNVAKNHCKDYFRSKYYRNRQKTTSLDTKYDLLSDGNLQSNSTVSELVKRLDPLHQEIIEMIYLNGYTQDEVAKIKNLPLGTVKSKTRKILKDMRALCNTSVPAKKD